MNRTRTTIWTTAFFIVVLSSFSFGMPKDGLPLEYRHCGGCGLQIVDRKVPSCPSCSWNYLLGGRPAPQCNNWVGGDPQNQHPHQHESEQINRAERQTQGSSSPASSCDCLPRWAIGLLAATVIAELAVSTTSAAFYFTGNEQLKDAESAMAEANKSCKKDAVKKLAHEVPSAHAFSSNMILTTPASDLIFGAIFALFALPASKTPLWPSLLTVFRTGLAAATLASVIIQKSNIDDFDKQLDIVSLGENCDLSKAKEEVSDASTNISNSIIASAVRLGISVLDVLLIVVRYSHQSRVSSGSI